MTVHYVNQTSADITPYFGVLQDALKTGEIDEDFSDVFRITLLSAFNDDGTDRLVIDWA